MLRRFLFVLAALAAMLPAGGAAAGTRAVLVVHSYHPGLPWTGQCLHGVDSVLAADFAVTHVFLDTKRIPESAFQERVDMALQRFRDLDPAVVILSDDNALRLLGPPLAKTGKPIVYMGINNNPRSYFQAMPANMTGVIERLPLFPWVRYLSEIVPNAAKMLVLMDFSATSQALIDVTFGNRKAVSFGGSVVEYRLAVDWDDWRRIVREAGSYGLIVMPLFHALADESGRHMPVEEVVRWTSANSPVPVFANQDYAVGDYGVVGAYVIHGDSHARLAASMARDILEGKSLQDLPVHNDAKGMFFFNKKQMQRFGLDLPQDIREQAVFQ